METDVAVGGKGSGGFSREADRGRVDVAGGLQGRDGFADRPLVEMPTTQSVGLTDVLTCWAKVWKNL